MTIRRGRWRPEDRAASVHQHVPFDVPPGTGVLEVTLSYDRSAGVIDLGLFDPDGFRGYSGGARDRFTIAPQQATPGYLAGDLPAGEWRVLLGLYRIPPEGLDWEVTISFDGAALPPPPQPPPVAERPPRRRLPAPQGRRWVAGDLHAHSVHSDGVWTVDELANGARSRGLDFLAVTDHNTVSHHQQLGPASARYDVQLIPGQEVTTDQGHANCFGSIAWVNFTEPPDAWLDHTTAAGGLMAINHPVVPMCGWNLPMQSSPQLVETWHKTWDRLSDEPLDWWRAAGGVPVGGSDFHSPHHGDRLGAPTTLVEVGDGDSDVMAAVAAGRVALSAEPFGPALLRVDDELVIVDGEGLRLVGPDGRPTDVVDALVTVADPEEGLHRLVEPSGRVMAMTP